MKAQIKTILIAAFVIVLSGIQIASALPSVNILGNYAVVGTSLNATTSANANFTASGSIQFLGLPSNSGCLITNTSGVLSTSTCGGITTSTFSALSPLSYVANSATFSFLGTYTGTPGQVHIASTSPTWTFTLPQTIWPTSTVNFGNLNSPTLTATGTLRGPNAAGGTTVGNAGEITVDTSSRTLNFHDGTAEVVLNPERNFTLTVPAPTSTVSDLITNNITLKHFDDAFTISKVSCVNVATSSNVTFQIYHGTTRAAGGGGAILFTTAQTCSNTTSSQEFTSFSDNTLAADEMAWVQFPSASSSQTSITVYGRFDP